MILEEIHMVDVLQYARLVLHAANLILATYFIRFLGESFSQGSFLRVAQAFGCSEAFESDNYQTSQDVL